MRPASAGMKPPMMCSSVLLPQPLGPMMVMNSPSFAAKRSTSRMASDLPSLAKLFLTPEACRAITRRLVPQARLLLLEHPVRGALRWLWRRRRMLTALVKVVGRLGRARHGDRIAGGERFLHTLVQLFLFRNLAWSVHARLAAGFVPGAWSGRARASPAS